MQLNQRFALMDLFPIARGARREFFRNFLMQVYFTFVQSIPMAAFIGFLFGILCSYQISQSLSFLGSQNHIYQLLVIVVFRELIPLTAALLLIARSVSAVATELATNKVQREIDAYEIMGINIYKFLLAPRIWGGTISMVSVAMILWAACLLGSWLSLNSSKNLPLPIFINGIASQINMIDILIFFSKTGLTGFVVFGLACHRGLQLDGAAFQIPQVTTKAIVDSITIALIIQVSITALYYAVSTGGFQ